MNFPKSCLSEPVSSSCRSKCNLCFPSPSTDVIDKSELKGFFETNCSQIYFIFYESFMTLESNLKQKGKRCCSMDHIDEYLSLNHVADGSRVEMNSHWECATTATHVPLSKCSPYSFYYCCNIDEANVV